MARYARPAVSPAEVARRARFETFMDVYYCAREAWMLAAEAATYTTPGLGHSEELDLWTEENPPLLFKEYLIRSRGEPR